MCFSNKSKNKQRYQSIFPRPGGNSLGLLPDIGKAVTHAAPLIKRFFLTLEKIQNWRRGHCNRLHTAYGLLMTLQDRLHVRVGSALYDLVMFSTGAPQETVLSSCSPCKPQNFFVTLSHATCRNTLITPHWLDEVGSGMRSSTEH